MAKGKHGYWLTEEGLLLLAGWAHSGLTDEQIAANMGISRSTLGEWKNKYSVISDTLKASKEVADFQIENALFKRAAGHTVKEEKVTKDGGIVALKREIPGDVTAQIFWLKNRKPAVWRDRPVEDGKADLTVILQSVREMDEIISKPAPDRNIEDYE